MGSRRAFLKTSAACFALPALMGASSTLWGQTNQLRVRKNLMSLPDNDIFFEQYGAAVKALHSIPTSDMRSWWKQATLHPDYCRHGTPNFTTWHRPYLAMFEEICQWAIKDNTFVLHYWDWSQKRGIMPNPFYDNELLNVTYWKDPGQYNGRMWGPVSSLPIRALNKGQGLQDDPARGGAFTPATLQTILRQTDFGNFTNMLERQPHNTGHVVCGFTANGTVGHIGDGLSPLDPIFWMHHCMVDYMWAQWQAAGNVTKDNDETYTMFVNQNGTPVTFTSKQVHDYKSLGYTYDTFIDQGNIESQMMHAEISTDFQHKLATQLSQSKRLSLGATSSSIVANAGQEGSLTASTKGLLAQIQNSRVFRTAQVDQPRLATEGKRVLAVLKNVGWPQSSQANEGLMVNVFVNCPYLSPTTPATDLHYAGTFSFFGSPNMGHMNHEQSIVIDITAAIAAQAASGQLTEKLKIQLMPIHPAESDQTGATFNVSGLEILAI